MYSGWPLLSRENENSLLLFNPHQSGVKGGTAFPRSLPLIIAFFKQVRINFCHPKHHRALLQHRSLLIHHQLLPVSLHWAETGWIVWISVLEAFIPGVLTPIKPFQEEMRTGATLPCNKSLHLALAGCHPPPPRAAETPRHVPGNHSRFTFRRAAPWHARLRLRSATRRGGSHRHFPDRLPGQNPAPGRGWRTKEALPRAALLSQLTPLPGRARRHGTRRTSSCSSASFQRSTHTYDKRQQFCHCNITNTLNMKINWIFQNDSIIQAA